MTVTNSSTCSIEPVTCKLMAAAFMFTPGSFSFGRESFLATYFFGLHSCLMWVFTFFAFEKV